MEFVDYDDFIMSGMQLIGEEFRKIGPKIFDLDEEDSYDYVDTLATIIQALNECRLAEETLHNARLAHYQAINDAVDFILEFRDPEIPVDRSMEEVNKAIEMVEKTWKNLSSAEYDFQQAEAQLQDVRDNVDEHDGEETVRLSVIIYVTD